MASYTALYNPYSNCGEGEKCAHRLDAMALDGNVQYVDITKIEDYSELFYKLYEEDSSLIVCGGDGTLNRFINATKKITFRNSVYYFACGTGNDFCGILIMNKGKSPLISRST